ncbi:hypothetical protein B0H14DRAFT_2881122, partial [Mycena olivaceomarginata]
MSQPFALERQLGLSAARRACALTSPLTHPIRAVMKWADYAAQALISSMLKNAFQPIPSSGKRTQRICAREEGKVLRDRIVELANEALVAPLVEGDKPEWGIGPGAGEERGGAAGRDRLEGTMTGGRTGRASTGMWTIDPIDGTKGFLRGEQYAVCIALLVDAQVQLGIIGCPNLPVDPAQPDGERGCLFVAVRGQGCHQIPLSGTSSTPLHMPTPAPSELTTLDQAKYGCLARGEGGIYLRMPTGVGYREKIWDHAPGSLLVSEAG